MNKIKESIISYLGLFGLILYLLLSYIVSFAPLYVSHLYKSNKDRHHGKQ